jgi:RHS repeat-associated protein
LSAAKSRSEAYAGKGRVGVYPERCNRFGNPLVGRFLSADPFIQAPEFSPSFNRYSYCLNNPLLYTDPTGFFAEGPDVDASGLNNNFDGSNDLVVSQSSLSTLAPIAVRWMFVHMSWFLRPQCLLKIADNKAYKKKSNSI